MTTGADEDPYVDTVDEIVAALRQDPVLVQDVMGNGHTAEVDAAITALVREAGMPVYVVLSVTPRDIRGLEPDAELLHVLHGRLGDGVYVVHTATQSGREVGVYGVDLVDHDGDGSALSNAAGAAARQVESSLSDPDHDVELSAAAEAALVVEMLQHDLDALPAGQHTEDGALVRDVLSPAEVHSWSAAPWTTAEQKHVEIGDRPDPGLPLVVGVAVALTTAVVGYRVLRAASALLEERRVRRRAPDPTEVLRGEARAGAAALGDRISASTLETTGSDLDARETARECLEAAERLLGGGHLELVAALVLARTGHHALDDPAAPAYTCCFLNPLHGEGTERAALGGREQVPVCRDCATALDRDEPRLDPLLEPRPGRDRPYYEGRSPWAETGFGSLDPERFRRTTGAPR